MNPKDQQLFLDIIQPENRMFLEVQIAELLFGNTTATDFKYNCIRYLQERKDRGRFKNVIRFRRKV